jgi:hypothetical protein
MGSNFKHRALIAMSLFKLDAEKNLQKTLDATKSIAARLLPRSLCSRSIMPRPNNQRATMPMTPGSTKRKTKIARRKFAFTPLVQR